MGPRAAPRLEPDHALLLELTSFDAFSNQIHRSDVISIIDFTAAWCGPCQRLKPHVRQLAEAHRGNAALVFCIVDVDALPEAAEHAKVRAMPTIKAFRNGIEIGTVVGVNVSHIEELVRQCAEARAPAVGAKADAERK